MGGGRDTSFVFVWPGKLEATAEAGLQARVPYRLTCVRVTAFESRFRGARNALLAGTAEGLALAFDWRCLLRDSAGGGKKEGRLEWQSEVLAPSAQVRAEGGETIINLFDLFLLLPLSFKVDWSLHSWPFWVLQLLLWPLQLLSFYRHISERFSFTGTFVTV